MQLDAKIPGGPLAEKWDRHRFKLKMVNPANKRKASRTARVALTALLPKAGLMRQKITKMTVTVYGACFMIP